MLSYGFVYLWTNTENGMKYIGSHHGNEDDGYIGSGVYFRRAYELTPSTFVRTILEYNTVIDDPYYTRALEQKHLDSVPQIHLNEEYYNLTSNVFGGWSKGLSSATDDRIKNISEAMKKQHAEGSRANAYKNISDSKKGKCSDIYPDLLWDQERKDNASEAMKKQHAEGRRKKAYKRISLSKIGKTKENDAGRKTTSEKLQGNQNWKHRKTSVKGRIHINNGIIRKLINIEDLDKYPGWNRGRGKLK